MFKYFTDVKPSGRGEFELGDAVKELSKPFSVQVVSVKEWWKPCSYPWDLLEINEHIILKKDMQRVVHPDSIIEEGVRIKGFVSVGEGTILKSGTYIEGAVVFGKNCVIGPDAYFFGASSIGDYCEIGPGTKVKNSVIGDYTKAKHDAYIGDSVLGEHVNCAHDITLTNWRSDEAEVKSMYNRILVGTGRTKFGAVIGDGVKISAGTRVMPGRKLWPNTTTMPNEVVMKDKVVE